MIYDILILKVYRNLDNRSKSKMQSERDAANGLYMTNKNDLESTINAVDEALTALKESRDG